MEKRRLSGTSKITVTIPEQLYTKILDYIKLHHEYTNYPDFIACALRYFNTRFVYDIEPFINEDIEMHAAKGMSIETVFFESTYKGDSVSKQSTVAIGVENNLHKLVNQYPYLNYQNIKSYSVEYYFNSIDKSRNLYSAEYCKSIGYINLGAPHDRNPPEIKYTTTYRQY